MEQDSMATPPGQREMMPEDITVVEPSKAYAQHYSIANLPRSASSPVCPNLLASSVAVNHWCRTSCTASNGHTP
ncbi:hypothetical protein OsI_36891 [Oryza sativa Indica Group]|uniref:Uncharacterized protein n=1 Tax=Oryza sativa subsp. indica TaxID=39946 RepID=B8BLN1_ORYSI|nr:hypothetical protein OsI_36891 [Oryza sativa Indica Group]